MIHGKQSQNGKGKEGMPAPPACMQTKEG